VNEVIQAAAELQSVCERQGWRFCFIGGVALQRWAEPRETVDADMTLLTGFGGEERFIQVLLEHWKYIRTQLRPLAELKGAPEILEKLEQRRIEFEQ